MDERYQVRRGFLIDDFNLIKIRRRDAGERERRRKLRAPDARIFFARSAAGLRGVDAAARRAVGHADEAGGGEARETSAGADALVVRMRGDDDESRSLAASGREPFEKFDRAAPHANLPSLL